jgi:Domain of unknown function (DUF4192)
MDALPSRLPDPDPDPDRAAPSPPDAFDPAEPEYTVRLGDPGDLAAALPHLMGFPPRESIVLVGLGGRSGSRVGLTLRVDIPPPDSAARLARAVAARLDTDGPDAAVLAIVSEAPDVPAYPDAPDGLWDGTDRPADLPHRQLTWHLTVALTAYGIPLREVLLVRAGRWWSYGCSEPCCGPGAGTPVPGGVTELAAASVAAGQVVAASREDVQARIARCDGPSAESMAAAVLRIGTSAAEVAATAGRDALAERYWDWITAAVTACGAAPDAPRPADDDVARVAWALRDALVRDRALGLCVGARADVAERLWTECTRRATPPLDAAPATLLAVSAWLRGDGALARIALDRALDSDPDYALAGLLSRGLDGCLPPRDLRAMIVGTLADLGAVSDLGAEVPEDLLADFGDVFPGEDVEAAPGRIRAAPAGATPGPARARPGRRSPSRTRRRRYRA